MKNTKNIGRAAAWKHVVKEPARFEVGDRVTAARSGAAGIQSGVVIAVVHRHESLRNALGPLWNGNRFADIQRRYPIRYVIQRDDGTLSVPNPYSISEYREAPAGVQIPERVSRPPRGLGHRLVPPSEERFIPCNAFYDPTDHKSAQFGTGRVGS